MRPFYNVHLEADDVLKEYFLLLNCVMFYLLNQYSKDNKEARK